MCYLTKHRVVHIVKTSNRLDIHSDVNYMNQSNKEIIISMIVVIILIILMSGKEKCKNYQRMSIAHSFVIGDRVGD
jgi:hypothetical protein